MLLDLFHVDDDGAVAEPLVRLMPDDLSADGQRLASLPLGRVLGGDEPVDVVPGLGDELVEHLAAVEVDHAGDPDLAANVLADLPQVLAIRADADRVGDLLDLGRGGKLSRAHDRSDVAAPVVGTAAG